MHLYMYMYRILSSKHPWAPVIDGQETGVGANYTDRPFVCITHIYVNLKKVGGRLNGDGRLLERIQYMYMYMCMHSQ